MTISPPPSTIGRYQVIRLIGRSNAVVYEGFDPTFNRRVAIKVLEQLASAEPDEKDSLLSRFKRELGATGSLNHPNVMQVYDVAEVGGVPAVICELLDGVSLESYIQANGTVDFQTAASILRPLLSALSYVHKQGIVHRDLKPANVQICADGTIKLLDFGLAQVAQLPKLTMTGLPAGGTPEFMSPEQWHPGPVDARSDLFSVGVIAYCLLVGNRPFTGTSIPSLYRALTQDEPSYPTILGSRATDFLKRALQKQPSARFQTADEMATALPGSASGPAISGSIAPVLHVAAKPPSPTPQGQATTADPVQVQGPKVVWDPINLKGPQVVVSPIKAIQDLARWWKVVLLEVAVAFFIPSLKPGMLILDAVIVFILYALKKKPSRASATNLAVFTLGLYFLPQVAWLGTKSEVVGGNPGSPQVQSPAPKVAGLPTPKGQPHETPPVRRNGKVESPGSKHEEPLAQSTRPRIQKTQSTQRSIGDVPKSRREAAARDPNHNWVNNAPSKSAPEPDHNWVPPTSNSGDDSGASSPGLRKGSRLGGN